MGHILLKGTLRAPFFKIKNQEDGTGDGKKFLGKPLKSA